MLDIPHLFFWLDNKTNFVYRKKYSIFKKTIVTGAMRVGITIDRGKLAKDAISS